MSDVFYLDIPRAQGSWGRYHPAPLARNAAPPQPPPATGCHRALMGEGVGQHALRLVVGVVFAGCVLSLATRLRRYLSARMYHGHTRFRHSIYRRRVYRAGMYGIPRAHGDRIALGEEGEKQSECSPLTVEENGTGHLNENHHGNNLGENMKDASNACSGEGGDDEKKKCSKSGRSSSSASSSSSLSSSLSLSLDSSHVFFTNAGERYRRVARLGRGGFGTVFKCMSLSTGQIVAVKEVRLSGAQVGNGTEGTNTDELRAEFELLSRIDHPNVIRLIGYHVGRRHARLFLEWAAGGSLRDTIRHIGASSKGDGLHEDLVRSYVQQILSALQYLHEHGIIHRDLKPQNMLVDHAGVLRVTDFGLSRLLADGASVLETSAAGTPRYMAPETVKNGCFSCGSDLWAVGATMSELLTGKLPWSHLQPAVSQQMPSLLYHIYSFPEEHPVIPSHISHSGKDFMERCFRLNPKDRGTASSLLQHPFFKQAR